MRKTTCIAALTLCLAHAAYAEDKSGVAPTRLSLPDGPGSVLGSGDNVSPDLNMGLLRYSIPIEVPKGREGLIPDVGLDYSSGAGSSLVGIGWSLRSDRSIERYTARGLPRYAPSDAFAANGGQELVPVAGTAFHRARFETEFARYRWVDEQGTGRGGYWVVEYRDGRIGYFGADARGVEVSEARVESELGTFRYHLVEEVDRFGHRVRYDYAKVESQSYLERISYVFLDDVARYEVHFAYEARPDVRSDARPGFEVRTTRRLAEITTWSHATRLRRYRLEYEPTSDARFLSRLAAVREWGRTDTDEHPRRYDLGYTPGLGEPCADADCEPVLVEVGGALGIDFRAGHAELIDFDGNALPDVLDTTDGHRFLMNNMQTTRQAFATVRPKTLAGFETARLASPEVRLADLDGDGLADLIDGANDVVLWNTGAMDWRVQENTPTRLPRFAEDRHLRFFDFDHDRKPDLLHADGADTWVRLNLGTGAYGDTSVQTEPLEVALGRDPASFGDMNGDGLPDVVRFNSDTVGFRMALGRGRWADWRDFPGAPTQIPTNAELADINGDGLDDLVIVQGGSVRYALNRSGLGFAPPVEITEAGGTALPLRETDTTVRFADMNGSGSTDVVWIDSSGQMNYLELSPRKGNLLARIDDHVGILTEARYGNSTQHYADAAERGAPWTRVLPHPVATLDEMIVTDRALGTRDVTTYTYADGAYDGREHQFRGFARVEVRRAASKGTDETLEQHRFDLGLDSLHFKGMLLSKSSVGSSGVLSRTEYLYEISPTPDCPAPAGAASSSSRQVCQVVERTEALEGQSEGRVVETRRRYDAFGRTVRTEALGVVAQAGGCAPCAGEEAFGAPCGAQCTGDERYEEVEWIDAPLASGRWIADLAYRTRSSAYDDLAEAAETLSYFDGTAFEGLPLGQAERGLLRRKEGRVDEQRFATRESFAHDEHGNVVEVRDGEGRRRTVGYDAHGHRAVEENVWIDDMRHLRMTATWDDEGVSVVRSSAPERVDFAVEDAPRFTHYAYDGLDRLSTIRAPDDPEDAPSKRFEIMLGEAGSRIIEHRRVDVGGPEVLEETQCLDGHGRTLAKIARLGPDRFLVRELQLPDARGSIATVAAPYEQPTDECPRAIADHARVRHQHFDALGRQVEVSYEDESIYGVPSQRRTVHGPGFERRFDELDREERFVFDGQDRIVAIEKRYESGVEATTSSYDARGSLARLVDPLGVVKTQHFDRLGRVIRVDDPDRGTIRYTYDDSDLRRSMIDARGIEQVYIYDGAGRPTARYVEGVQRVETAYDEDASCEATACVGSAGLLTATRFPGTYGFDTDAFSYDLRGRTTLHERWIDGVRLAVEQSHDAADRVAALLYPDDVEVRFKRDGAGRVEAVPGFVTSATYASDGVLDRVLHANGVTTHYLFDARGRLDKVDTTAPDGSLLEARDYAWDPASNLAEVQGHGAHGAHLSALYGYDEQHRLKSVDYGDEQISLLFDAAGRIQEKWSTADGPLAIGQLMYEGGPAHAPSRVGDDTATYDESGRTKSLGTTTFAYDALGRLERIEDETTTAIVTNDADDRRARKDDGVVTRYHDPLFGVRDGRMYVYAEVDGRRVARHEAPATFVTRQLDVGPLASSDVDFVARPDGEVTAGDAVVLADHRSAKRPHPSVVLAAVVRRMLQIENAPAEVVFLHGDHLGSVSLTTGEAGALHSASQTYAFGATRKVIEGTPDRFDFTGKERELDGRIADFGVRVMSTGTGRFLAPDPAFEITTPEHLQSGRTEVYNPYVYAQNNPMKYVDPTGFMSEPGVVRLDPALFSQVQDMLQQADLLSFIPIVGGMFAKGTREKAFFLLATESEFGVEGYREAGKEAMLSDAMSFATDEALNGVGAAMKGVKGLADYSNVPGRLKQLSDAVGLAIEDGRPSFEVGGTKFVAAAPGETASQPTADTKAFVDSMGGAQKVAENPTGRAATINVLESRQR